MNREESGIIKCLFMMIFVAVIMTAFTGVSAMAELTNLRIFANPGCRTVTMMN